jgi:nucleoside-triphosphatase
LTGPPGIGKTTLLERVASHFSSQGVKIGGFTTSEVREHGRRIGFKIIDLSTGGGDWLSRKNGGTGPRVGSYRVISENLEKFGVEPLRRAIADPIDLLLIDEVGPMEMTSLSFRRSISRVFSADKPIVATVKLGSHYPEIEKVRGSCFQFEVTLATRDEVFRRLIEQIANWIEG